MEPRAESLSRRDSRIADANGAAEVLRLVQEQIEPGGYAHHQMSRDRLAHEVGGHLALIQKGSRRTISPAVQTEFRNLPDWEALGWHQQHQRSTTASGKP